MFFIVHVMQDYVFSVIINVLFVFLTSMVSISTKLKPLEELSSTDTECLWKVHKTKATDKYYVCAASLLAPRVQQPAPNFSGTAVINDDFKTIQLSDYKGKYVVLVFYPLDFTFVCPTELIALDDRIDDFKALNAEVIGCSIDSHFSHLGWMNTKRAEGGLGKLRYPLLSDINKKIAKDYDVLLETDGVALRGMFIIDPNGILRQITVNDLPVGRSVDEALRIIEALRFVEEHGEVCPANWKKGQKTIKPDPKGSQDYFKSTHS